MFRFVFHVLRVRQIVGKGKAEIVPLTRPFGLYAGCVLKGMMKFKGEPVANTEVEVEYWQADKKMTVPNEGFITQKVKTDKKGVLTFSPPKAGWWGFSPINSEKQAIQQTDGTKKDVKYDAVLWAQFTDWPAKE